MYIYIHVYVYMWAKASTCEESPNVSTWCSVSGFGF